MRGTKVPAKYAGDYCSEIEQTLEELRKEMSTVNAKVEVTGTFVSSRM